MRSAPLLACVALLCVSSAASTTPLQMLSNGDFEQELDVGWYERLAATNATLERTTTAHPDPDYELRLAVANGVGELAAVQRFEVPDLGMSFHADLCCSASGSGGAWSAAGLLLTYRDRSWNLLGNTAIVARSEICPWYDTPTFHVTPTVHGLWESYAFELTDELAHLPGVDAAAIAWLEVAILIEADNC